MESQFQKSFVERFQEQEFVSLWELFDLIQERYDKGPEEGRRFYVFPTCIPDGVTEISLPSPPESLEHVKVHLELDEQFKVTDLSAGVSGPALLITLDFGSDELSEEDALLFFSAEMSDLMEETRTFISASMAYGTQLHDVSPTHPAIRAGYIPPEFSDIEACRMQKNNRFHPLDFVRFPDGRGFVVHEGFLYNPHGEVVGKVEPPQGEANA